MPELKKIASNQRSILDKMALWKTKPTPLGRLRALWTLEGLNAIDEQTFSSALNE